MGGFDASEVFEMASNLKTSGSKAKQVAAKVIAKTAHDISGDAKQIAPVDIGNLKNSIGVSMLSPLEAEIGPTAKYGIYLELGTSRMAAQPFMGPATDRRLPGFLQAMGQVADGVL